MRVLYLYTTSGCHLCDLAEAMLRQQPMSEPLELQAIDISESDELVEAYGIRIPVLRFAESADELGWPFSAGELEHFLKVQKTN